MASKGLKTGLNLIFYFQLIILLFSSLFFGCASMQQPTGGPKDSIPPKVLKESPKNLTRNFKADRISIQLDEFFKLNNEFKEISISPAMEQTPLFKIKKNVLEIRLQDTLEKNTTYSINFGNAIADVNEGNVLKNYSYVFATGNVIDSLSISGKIINTLTKQPVLDATVFILPVRQDTLFGKKRASIFTTTDSSGNYRLKNLRDDTYKIYALKEEGGDRIYNSSNELIAFKSDSILLTRDIQDINLELFKGETGAFRIQDRKIENSGRILLTFNITLNKPDLEILQPAELNNTKFLEFSRTGDTAMLWLPQMTFDSLTVIPKDGTTNLDTVILRRNKKDTYNQSIAITDNLSGGKLKPGGNLELTFSAPVSKFDASKIKLLEDSVAKRAEIIKDTTSFRKYSIKYRWRNKKEYILDLGENAFFNESEGKSKATTRRFTLEETENYGNLILDISAPDTSRNFVIQLLRGEGEILRNDIVKGNKKINYIQYPTGTYYIRVVYDLNNNGKWDTGDVRLKRQPEPVWNYEKEFTLRANWDLEEKITIPPLQ
jgi:hypothetical protein